MYWYYRVTKIKQNPRLGWKIFKIKSKQMKDICFLKSGKTVKTSLGFYSVTKLKKTSLISLISILTISQPKHGFCSILITLH
jgi:hypothetical protein